MKPNSSEPVLVSLVTHNEETFLQRCLESLLKQTVPVRVKIFDNASRDRTREVARRFPVELFESERNRGFSYGHNRNLLGERFDYALLVNADVVLGADYLEQLMGVFQELKGTGMAGGKLRRMDAQGREVLCRGRSVLDSTGIFFTPSQRHFDRGNGEEDRGQYDRRQLVFGITGAVLLCSREMLEDLRYGDEYLDLDFFAYREDADLAWRAQLRGWKAVYEPRACGLHQRCVIPSRRRQLSPLVNYHSLKNRYLMRAKNMDSAVRKRCLPYMWIRDTGIFLYTLLFEWSSLPAYREVWRLREKFERKREHVQTSRRVSPQEMARWFSFRPVARDV